MNAPDTSPRKTLPVNGGRLWWLSPGFVGGVADDGTPSGEAAAVTWRLPSAAPTTGLQPAWATMTVTAQPTRSSLTVSAVSDAMSGTMEYGAAWLYTRRNGYEPVRVARVDGTTVYLVDRLDRDLTIGTEARLQCALWWGDVTAPAVVGSVTRTDAGDFPIPYDIAWPILQPANAGADISGTTKVGAGTLSVVRQRFDTRLTTDGVVSRYPELGRMAQAGSSGLASAIFAEGQALRLRVDAAVRQAGAAPYTWADDVDPAPFIEAHAAMVAARVVESTSPDAAQRHRTRAESFFDMALSIAWTDLNRDGIVDAGESPGLVGISTAGKALPSAVPTVTAWWSQGERR